MSTPLRSALIPCGSMREHCFAVDSAYIPSVIKLSKVVPSKVNAAVQSLELGEDWVCICLLMLESAVDSKGNGALYWTYCSITREVLHWLLVQSTLETVTNWTQTLAPVARLWTLCLNPEVLVFVLEGTEQREMKQHHTKKYTPNITVFEANSVLYWESFGKGICAQNRLV